jgi:lipoprotein-anchoring transpeptidase ErfK/SrfK
VDFGKGQIGNFNKKITIPIGDKKVMVADSAHYVADVSINDKPAKHFLVTMGDERFPSASGYLVLMDKQRHAHFVASTIGLKPGDPANYGELDVNYATRLTPSGEFIHQATDSAVAYIGRLNLSHGCIGMDEAGASWVFNNMGVGDVVKVINSKSESARTTDGFGDWNIPWAHYASRAANGS